MSIWESIISFTKNNDNNLTDRDSAEKLKRIIDDLKHVKNLEKMSSEPIGVEDNLNTNSSIIEKIKIEENKIVKKEKQIKPKVEQEQEK